MIGHNLINAVRAAAADVAADTAGTAVAAFVTDIAGAAADARALLADAAAESFDDWGFGGCPKCIPALREDGTKISPPGDRFDEPPYEKN